MCFIINNRNAIIVLKNYFDNYPKRQQPKKGIFSTLVTNLRTCRCFDQQLPQQYKYFNEHTYQLLKYKY